MKPSVAERDAHIVNLRAEGMTLHDIAEEFGLTRERVRQILVRRGGPTAKQAREAALDRRAAERERDVRRVIDDLELHPASTTAEIADRLGIYEPEIRSLVPDDMRAKLIATPKNTSRRWSEEAIVSVLREASTFSFPLGKRDYDRLLLTGEISGPSAVRICQVYGNFGAACRAAGVEAAAPRPNRDYQSRWTDDDILAAVRAYLDCPGYTGSFAGYDAWRREAGVNAPSSALMRQRLGTWSQAKAKAVST